MKLYLPMVSETINIRSDKINVLVVEDEKKYYQLAIDILQQANKFDKGIVLSNSEKLKDFGKNVDVLTQFLPFDINRKTLITKLYNKLNESVIDEFYADSCELKTYIEKFLIDVTNTLSCDIEYDDVDPGQLFKLSNVRFASDPDSLCSMILDYCSNVLSLEGEKLFVLVGVNQFIDESDYKLFVDTALHRKIECLIIENSYHRRSANDVITTIDRDGCVI